MNIFEKASKTKVRFETSKGEISTEELWDLSLNTLDSIAKSVNKKLKEQSEESFISAKSVSNTETELKMEIIKHVISVRLFEKERQKALADERAQAEFLESLLTKKKTEALENLSVEEIEAQIKALKKQEV